MGRCRGRIRGGCSCWRNVWRHRRSPGCNHWWCGCRNRWRRMGFRRSFGRPRSSSLAVEEFVERFWNIVHYFTYRGVCELHRMTNRINPFVLLHRIPSLKRLYKRRHIDIRREIDHAWERPDIGLSSIFAGGAMGILVFLFCLGLRDFYCGVTRAEFGLGTYQIVILIAAAIAVNHILLFRHDKYLDYFHAFEKMTGTERRKWAWATAGVFSGTILFAIGSFMFWIHRLK